MGGFYATAQGLEIEFKGWVGFRLGMDEVTVLDILTILLVLGLFAERLLNQRSNSERFDDIVEGLGVFANEMISRTDKLSELAGQMPEISLHNHNPLESLINGFLKLKGLDTNNITNPRDAQGRYAAPPEIETDTSTWEEVDVID